MSALYKYLEYYEMIFHRYKDIKTYLVPFLFGLRIPAYNLAEYLIIIIFLDELVQVTMVFNRWFYSFYHQFTTCSVSTRGWGFGDACIHSYNIRVRLVILSGYTFPYNEMLRIYNLFRFVNSYDSSVPEM